jgi:hypothetical protein
MGNIATQGVVGSTMAISPQEECQVNLSLPAIAIGAKVDLLLLDRSPHPFHEDVVAIALPS